MSPFFFTPIRFRKYQDTVRDHASFQNALKRFKHSSWFMQDGARPHRTVAVLNFLNEHFDDRVIALDYEKHKQRCID